MDRRRERTRPSAVRHADRLPGPPQLVLYVKERLGHENISTTADLYNRRVAFVDASIAEAVGASIFAEEESNVAALRPG